MTTMNQKRDYKPRKPKEPPKPHVPVIPRSQPSLGGFYTWLKAKYGTMEIGSNFTKFYQEYLEQL